MRPRPSGLAHVTTGCAVTRGQETVGAYVDDTAITTAVKARFVDNKQVDASSSRVETLNGTVMLWASPRTRWSGTLLKA